MLFVGTSIIHPSTEGVFLLCNILDLLIYSYQLVYPETEFFVCPSDIEFTRENWHTKGEWIDQVLGEMERCGGQFHKILRELPADSEF